jgi:outer membrane protein TolC
VERVVTLTLLAMATAVGGVQAQGVVGDTTGGRALTLAEALQRAELQSEQVMIATAAVQRAEGSVVQARSGYLPQLNGTFSYGRTLKSQFQGLGGASEDTTTAPVPCDPFSPNPALPLEQRVGALEAQLLCPADGGGGGFGGVDFSEIGFGAANNYNLGLSFAQPLFAGGRIVAQNRAASAGRSAAEIGLASARAQLRLDATEAYYDAELAERMLEIAEATLAQAEATLSQAELQQRVGSTAEFDVLRARVARDNQRPVVIQARSARDLAFMRLKQMLNLPLGEPITLTTRLGEGPLPEPATVADTTGFDRAPVRQAMESLNAQESQLRIAKSQFLPSVSLTSQYGRVAYPSSLIPEWNQFRSNWSVGLSMSLPIFTGGRLHGQSMTAQANVKEAQAQLQQVRELAELDTRNTLEQLRAARASLEASSGTVQQAERAYQIAELRYREGISTQLELADARILLQQARVNRAQAERDAQIAQMKVELLPDLPLSTAGAATQLAGPTTGQTAAQAPTGATATGAGAQGPGGAGAGAGVPSGVPGQQPGGGVQQ